jgi:hypothetical protein
MASIRTVSRIVVGALVIFLVYNGLLLFLRPRISRGQHQWQDNVINAQRYIYSSSRLPVVVVGSSLSTRLRDLPADYFNLALGGSDCLTGLAIVLREGYCPKLVLIEANSMRGVDEGFVAKLYASLSYPLRRYLPALREENNPLTVLMSAVSDRVVRDPDVPGELLQLAVARAKVPIDNEFRIQNGRNLDQLEKLVRSLISNASIPVFYWMPLHPAVSVAPRTQYERLAFHERFPDDRYYWLADPPPDRFKPADGLHLARPEAVDYSRQFVMEVESIRKQVERAHTKTVTSPIPNDPRIKTGSK